MRLRHPLLPGEPLTPLARRGGATSATASARRCRSSASCSSTPTSHPPARRPAGEWIGLDARTLLHPGGIGVRESVLHDERGPVGRAFQTLVVQPR